MAWHGMAWHMTRQFDELSSGSMHIASYDTVLIDQLRVVAVLWKDLYSLIYSTPLHSTPLYSPLLAHDRS
jgi:hypothetical protein